MKVVSRCSAPARVSLSGVFALLWLFQGGAELSLRAHAGAPQQAEGKLDTARLEVIEDLSEALANDMLELSVATRDRDAAKTSEFFPARLTASTFPSRPGAVKTDVKWIGSRAWTAEEATVVASLNGPPSGAGALRPRSSPTTLSAWM